MKFNDRSRHLLIGLFILVLLFAPSMQKAGSAQEGDLIPGGLGEPPVIVVDKAVDRGQINKDLDRAEAKYFAFLPLAVDPSPPSPISDCGELAQEKTLATLAITDPNQGRPAMNCHPILAQVAHARALDMGQRAYFGHITPDNVGPNFLVSQAGYQLPPWWPDTPDENYIESIAGGYTTAEAAWNAWLESENHRSHVLGEVDFWAEQTNYGMGYAYIKDSPFGHYWVFITAPPEGS